MKESWYQRNKHKYEAKIRLRSWRLKTRYGISLETFEEMFNTQEGRCAICKEEKKLHVDHCHETGKVRGLLCYHCNNGLGCLKDSLASVLNAADYLKRNG